MADGAVLHQVEVRGDARGWVIGGDIVDSGAIGNYVVPLPSRLLPMVIDCCIVTNNPKEDPPHHIITDHYIDSRQQRARRTKEIQVHRPKEDAMNRRPLVHPLLKIVRAIMLDARIILRQPSSSTRRYRPIAFV